MQEMKIVPLSALRDNYIWALCSHNLCAVVDPGEASPVEQFLATSDLQLAAILLTHRHNDHLGGVASLTAKRTIPVYGPLSAEMPQVSRPVADGMKFNIPGFDCFVEVISVPGHTEEHIAYRTDGALFCGDTLFAGGCGRLLGGTALQLYTSLARLSRLPPDTRIYCAHEYTIANLRFAQTVEPGNMNITRRLSTCESLRQTGTPTLPSLLQDELDTNPFLRTGVQQVRAAVEAKFNQPVLTDESVFAALRTWKDQF